MKGKTEMRLWNRVEVEETRKIILWNRELDWGGEVRDERSEIGQTGDWMS